MTDATFNLSICLKIETEENIDFITDVLNLRPTDLIKKGERKSRVLDAAESNIWIYDVKYGDCKNIEGKISEFLDGIPQLFQKTKDLERIGTVTIRISIVSDFAQLGVGFSKKDLSLLSCLQIPIEISVLSWGQCT